jgi:hypothetical protein
MLFPLSNGQLVPIDIIEPRGLLNEVKNLSLISCGRVCKTTTALFVITAKAVIQVFCSVSWIPARATYRQLGRNDARLMQRTSETPH